MFEVVLNIIISTLNGMSSTEHNILECPEEDPAVILITSFFQISFFFETTFPFLPSFFPVYWVTKWFLENIPILLYDRKAYFTITLTWLRCVVLSPISAKYILTYITIVSNTSLEFLKLEQDPILAGTWHIALAFKCGGISFSDYRGILKWPSSELKHFHQVFKLNGMNLSQNKTMVISEMLTP